MEEVDNELVSAYLQFCALFGESALIPWSEFISMPYRIINEIIKQRSKINNERQKALEESMKQKSKK